MIITHDLNKSFGSTHAVQDLNLHIPAGTFYAFLGPNAAGKTTTIKLLVWLLKPSSGYITINNTRLEEYPLETKKLISYVPDEPFLYEKLTGREFLIFIADLYELPETYKQKQLPELLDLFDITTQADDLIEGYSHGTRQKLVFCAALLHDPQVMIIDEPLVGLDPKSARVLKQTLKTLTQDKGITIFMSTHTLSVAEELADTIGIIDHGTLIAEGSAEQLRTQAGIQGSLEDVFLRLTNE